jgi:hypothetical protein
MAKYLTPEDVKSLQDRPRDKLFAELKKEQEVLDKLQIELSLRQAERYAQVFEYDLAEAYNSGWKKAIESGLNSFHVNAHKMGYEHDSTFHKTVIAKFLNQVAANGQSVRNVMPTTPDHYHTIVQLRIPED